MARVRERVRVGGQFNSLEALRAMPIRGASGNQLRLGDFATLSRGYIDPPQVKVHHDGDEVIALGVSSHERSPILPEVPAISDSLPGFESSTVNYMTVRTGTPRAAAASVWLSSFLRR
mgnify:CR=1 FL=1